MDLFTPQESGSREQSFLADLSVLMVIILLSICYEIRDFINAFC